MNLSIVSHYNDDFASVGDITSKINAEYCARHGYNFILARGDVSKGRGVVWSKIALLQELMEKDKSSEWFLWIDADALFMNHELKLENRIEPDCNLIITHDVNGLNSGVFLIKNCDWSRNFLSIVWAIGDMIEDNHLAEQYSMAQAIQMMPETIVRVAQYWINSYLYEKYGHSLDTEGNFTEGDLILHLPGMSHEDRVAILNEYLPKIVR